MSVDNASANTLDRTLRQLPTGVARGNVIADTRLETLYHYWLERRGTRAMPRRADIDPVAIPAAIWPHVMILEVLREGATIRFRYRRAGGVFWRAGGVEPTGHFIEDVLPATAGYLDYVVAIYTEMVASGRPMYSENFFTRDGQSVPMRTRRVSLPLSNDGAVVDTVLAGHVFEYPRERDPAFPIVDGLREAVRVYLDEAAPT
ncbi:MAG TPA: PAS domain-containing protein [Stellaceae bacterium]|nr:PAS domain-containing protein [Stellaceae bacterium]